MRPIFFSGAWPDSWSPDDVVTESRAHADLAVARERISEGRLAHGRLRHALASRGGQSSEGFEGSNKKTKFCFWLGVPFWDGFEAGIGISMSKNSVAWVQIIIHQFLDFSIFRFLMFLMFTLLQFFKVYSNQTKKVQAIPSAKGGLPHRGSAARNTIKQFSNKLYKT